MSLNTKAKIKTLNPTTGEVEKVFDVLTAREIEEKLATAHNAYLTWKKTDFKTRANLLKNVAKIFREEKNELAKLAAIEMGKIVGEGIIEVEACAKILDFYAQNAEDFLKDKPMSVEGVKAYMSYEPLGIILSVQPWNFPYSQVIRNVAPNIMCGNVMAVKHASNVPQCALKIEEIFKRAGAQKGVYTNLFITGSEISNLVSDKRIQGVTLTGSLPAGSSIAAAAGKYIKKSVLELGGNDAFIVLGDADMNKVIEHSTIRRLRNAGQVCASPKRVIIVDSLYDEYIQKSCEIYKNIKIGNPLESDTKLAPLSSKKALDEVMSQIEKAVSQGAKLIYGGKRVGGNGAFMQPTILTDITSKMDIYHEEVFGPVLCVYKAKDEKEAIALANDSDFGLGATIMTQNTELANKLAKEIQSGMVGINMVISSSPELPFGGVKHSGYGRELSQIGIYEFVNQKLIRFAK
ncbi:MAG: NAD-dependent succinate-semialdehyde dehydrogenase [Campylobacteraceae bacterium]